MSQLYSEAAQLVRGAVERRQGLGRARSDAAYALAADTLRFREALETTAEAAQFWTSREARKTDRYLLLVLLRELLLRGQIAGGGKSRQAVLAHRARLQAEFARLKIRRKAVADDDLADKPAMVVAHYARINRLRVGEAGVEAVAARVTAELPELRFAGTRLDPGREWERLESDPTLFYQDAHLDDVLVFAASVAVLGKSALVADGILVLQQKSSCFPAVVATANASFSLGLDACAAPGNKTSHLAASLVGDRRVWACEKDRKRADLLASRMQQMGADKYVEVVRGDFLLGPHPAPEAQVAVVDPSCSGSGMVGRAGEADNSPERLAALADFQRKCVLRAMSGPKMQRVVYSTCSVHEEENENVVRAVLAESPGWRLGVAQIPNWPDRGRGQGMEGCIRAEAVSHHTIGFFVAVFERQLDESPRKEGEPVAKKRKKKKKKKKKKKTTTTTEK